MKRKDYLVAALLMTGLYTSSCSKGDEMEISAQPGSPIAFGVASVNPSTRTIYEDRLQINWVKGDWIGICSPSENVLASEGLVKKEANYQVDLVNADGHLHHATLNPVEENKFLKWGNDLEKKAVFYGAYPAERVREYPKENNETFSMEYYTNQCCTISSCVNGIYLTQPNMKNAYMMAKNELQPIGDHVLLAFDPIMTTLDMKVTAGHYEVGTGIIQPVTITGISVIMPKKISSVNLNYQITDLTNGIISSSRGHLTNNVQNGKESIFIGIKNEDKNYVDLFEGESINLMAFLPPIPDLKDVIIKVHAVGNLDFKIQTPKDRVLPQQSKIDITLPDISPDSIKSNNWISQLDDNTLLKNMSIPAYVCTGNKTEESIKKLFEKGVRAFDIGEYVSSKLLGKDIIDEQIVNSISEMIKGTNEFVIVWVNSNVTRPDGWIDFPTNIQGARNNVIILEKHKGVLISRNKFTNIGDSKEQFSFKTISKENQFTLDNNSSWDAQFIDTETSNKAIYDKLVNSEEQSICTGIVTIPHVGIQFDSSYGDLLLQAIIDSNFKCRKSSN